MGAGLDINFWVGVDMAEKSETKEDAVETEGKSGLKKIIIIVIVLLVVGGGAGFYFMNMGDDSQDGDDTTGAETEQSVETEELEEDAIYLALSPAFVVNFESNGRMRYLQLGLQIMAYEQEVVDKVAANMPAVRNSLIMLFSEQDYDVLSTSEGKDKLRGEVLESIHLVVRLKNGRKVNDVFFTNFVMQ